MKRETRRGLIKRLGCLWAACAALSGCPPRVIQERPRVVTLVARRWRFEPPTITLTAGVPVVLELTSADGHHGFSAAALGLHADLAPGVPVHLAFTPPRAGTFAFRCDVFCGEGHEEMIGDIIVAR
jgi:cytochrome c oxidase subunit 2